MKKKVLISGYYGFDNFGDELILSLLLDKLKDCDVTVLTANPRKTFDTYGIHTVQTFSYPHVMKEITRCDVLISGGGSLLQNVTSNASLLFYVMIIRLALMLKKEVVIFAQGIGPVKGFMYNNLVKGVLKEAKYISVRDEKSKKLLDKWKIKSNLVCDPAFSLEVSNPERTSKIGVQLRKFDTLTDELFDNIIKQIRTRYYNREIELLSLQDEVDVGISQVFINKFKKVEPNINIKLVKGLNNKQIIERISEYDALIGMRYHACLVGAKYGVKTLAIAYDPKVNMLAEDLGLPVLSMKDKDNDYEKAFNDMENLSRWNLMERVKGKIFSWNATGINEIRKEKKKKMGGFWNKEK
jgi:polysaccharide pyruvyl transferase CsaB